MLVRFGILLYLCRRRAIYLLLKEISRNIIPNKINMKKLLLTLLAVMVTVAVNAERVSKQEALMKARQFMPDKQFGETKAFARSREINDVEPFYIFNVADIVELVNLIGF